MSKFRITVFLLLCFQGIMFSQNSLEYGAKVGVNFSGFHVTSSSTTSYFGPQLGGFIRLSIIEEKLNLRADLLYSKKGGEITVREDNIPVYILESKLNYIDIPVLIEYEFVRNLSFSPGIQIGLLVSDDLKISDSNIEIIDDRLNSFDFGLVGGFVYQVSERLFVETKYNYGLIKVFKEKRSKNSTISLALGYSF